MPFTADAVHRMLDHLAGNTESGAPITHAALHTAQPSTDTPNEVTGGDPAYERKAIAFESAAGGEAEGNLDMTTQPVFDVPAGTTVTHVGFWTDETDGTLMAWDEVEPETFAAQGTYTLTDADLSIT